MPAKKSGKKARKVSKAKKIGSVKPLKADLLPNKPW